MTRKSMSIGAAMKARMTDAEPEAGTLAKVSAPEVDADPLESFNTRLPRSLNTRLKIYAASERLKIQDVIHAALEAYLEERK